jgi:6-pyruvoyltetrahydropterin/6-carboxytetrahydropterin synthase
LIDFDDIEKAFKPLHDQLDHKYLNNIDGLDNPTSENVAKWIWENIHSVLPQINKVILRESPESGCIYQGEE